MSTISHNFTVDLKAEAAEKVKELQRQLNISEAGIFRCSLIMMRLYVFARRNGLELRTVDPKNPDNYRVVELPISIKPSLLTRIRHMRDAVIRSL
jgi:hypothetical protein